MSSYNNCSNSVVMTLARIFSVARNKGNVDDLEKLSDALCVLRPDWVQWDVYKAWLHIRRYEWIEGLRLLRQVDSRNSHLPICTALLSCCLYAVKDATWQSYAMQALEQKEDAEATRIATKLVKFAEEKQEVSGFIASVY